MVVHPNFVEKAHQLFYRFGIRIVEGRRYLGGFIGSDEGKIRFTLKKVQEWLDCLGELSKVAEKEPQAALVGLTRSLQCEWNFVQRVVKDTSQLFAPLEKMLEENFLPSLLFALRSCFVFTSCQKRGTRCAKSNRRWRTSISHFT